MNGGLEPEGSWKGKLWLLWMALPFAGFWLLWLLPKRDGLHIQVLLIVAAEIIFFIWLYGLFVLIKELRSIFSK